MESLKVGGLSALAPEEGSEISSRKLNLKDEIKRRTAQFGSGMKTSTMGERVQNEGGRKSEEGRMKKLKSEWNFRSLARFCRLPSSFIREEKLSGSVGRHERN